MKKKPAVSHKETGVAQIMSGINTLIEQVVGFGKKKPLILIAVIVAVISALCWLNAYLTTQEILPEAREPKVAKVLVLKKGGTLMWVGMEVAEVSSTIRKEFKIPGNIKGMFVINEGTDLAGKYGVKTADVIVAISRQAVPNDRTFVKVANGAHFREGITLDIFRNGQSMYITIPFKYQYGPLMGPNKGSWQLGSPVVGQGIQYGPVFR